MVRAALLIDKASAERALNDEGYFHRDDKDLVESLASAASLPNIEDPFERVDEFSKILNGIPSVRELRDRAEKDQAPFEVVGDIFTVWVPSRLDQPRRFRAWVKRNSPYAGQIISLKAKGRAEEMRLIADPGIENSSRIDLQLSHEQFVYLFGSKPDQPRRAVAHRSSSTYVVDPSCPKHKYFPASHCKLAEKQDYRDLSSPGGSL